ncbi:MAG: hypothetical protein LBL50_00005, partial [Candidatus Margulisbacteria bacterium]|nr:hypothetical protein [Candidatus Margulisiibacteriota bacterium]
MKKFCLLLGLLGQLGAAYIAYDDTGTRYLTLSEDAQYVYLWQANGQLASQKFPYRLPDKTKLLQEPYFEDLDGDGELDIALLYQDEAGKYFKMALRQNGEVFDDRVWPKEMSGPEQTAVTVDQIIDEHFLSAGRAGYNKKYDYYQGLFRHVWYEQDSPEPQPLREIYSQQPTHDLTLANSAEDFERYVLLRRRDTRERHDIFAVLTSPNTETTLTLNYPEGIYPWQLSAFDWLNNYTAQEILYYYDHTPPEYAEPENGLEIYFSPNGDGMQDLLTIATTPSDNLYYTQTALLDIFDGPTYINSL